MAKRKVDEVAATGDADLMAMVEATEPAAVVEAPAEPRAETAMEAPVAPPASPRPGGAGAFLGLVLGGVIAAGAGFGLARFMPDLLPLTADTGLDATVQVQAEELSALREQIAALVTRADSADGRIADQTSVITALASKVAEIQQAGQADLSGLPALS